MKTTRKDYLELLEGQEFLSLTYEGCIMIKNGKLWQRGKMIKSYLKKAELKQLFSDLCWAKGIF